MPAEQGNATRPLQAVIDDFLIDLAQANRPRHTQRAYASDLHQFAHWHPGSLATISAQCLREFFASLAHLSVGTRARKQASLSTFFRWAGRQGLLPHNPMTYIERLKPDPPRQRGIDRRTIETVIARIPAIQRRDRLFFRLLLETGVRVGEALNLYVEDLDLTWDDERIEVRGKGNCRRTVLLDDPALVQELRTYLKHTHYQHGPLFRASKNGRGGPLRYQSVQARWATYCRAAAVQCPIHHLRHIHATELVNDGVSLATIRKRLGHKHVHTTLRYAEQADATVDAELRAWRRRRQSRS
ncbi:MAG TPA: tyrosine-type recombinase/integrase [Herpetosiphonaceae bacterium]|nr:tyrosine-type recombinase/integrase [Herpetosiphonaceae bacterium]